MTEFNLAPAEGYSHRIGCFVAMLEDTRRRTLEQLADLDEALTPYSGVPDNGMAPAIGPVTDGDQIPGVAVRAGGDLWLSGADDDYVEVSHSSDLELSDGTVSLTFVADEVWSRRALFSKDASQQEHGGHLTAYLESGRLKVRLQQQGDGDERQRRGALTVADVESGVE